MPSREIAAKELAEVFKVISHADRLRIIEELRAGEIDVSSLASALALPGPRVSQHLSLMRAHRLVDERRDGRRRLYRLTHPDIAPWIVQGLSFLEDRVSGATKSSINSARRLWSDPPSLEEGSHEGV